MFCVHGAEGTKPISRIYEDTSTPPNPHRFLANKKKNRVCKCCTKEGTPKYEKKMHVLDVVAHGMHNLESEVRTNPPPCDHQDKRRTQCASMTMQTRLGPNQQTKSITLCKKSAFSVQFPQVLPPKVLVSSTHPPTQMRRRTISPDRALA